MDVGVGGVYQPVVDALSALVKSAPIENVYLGYEPKVGTDKNFSTVLGSPEVKTWEHFALTIPSAYIVRKDAVATKLGEIRSTKDVFLRGLQEITLDSVDTVLELIAQNSLYRGEENKFVLDEFRKLKVQFAAASGSELFAWKNLKSAPESVLRIRNTSIGTLLTDLSEGVDLVDAVTKFEAS